MRNAHTLKNNLTTLKYVDSDRFFLIKCLLASVHSILLLGFICYQFYQPLFLNSDTWVFVYLFLFLSFSIDFVYFYFYQKIKDISFFQWSFLFLDAVLMTVCLSAVIPLLYSVLIFIYMLQIFSAGLLGQYKGAFTQGLLVSFLFSWTLILYSSGVESDQSLVFSFLINNFGFMTVAGLSGFFGHHAKKMKWSLMAANEVVNRLENLNDLIADNINMGLFILDEETFIVHSNQAALNILNLPSGFSAPVHQVFPELREYMVSNEGKEEGHLNIEYQNGSDKLSIEAFVSPIEVFEQEKQKYLILFQDRTQMHEIEKKVQEKEKFASIGRMAAGIAHELRNPLSSIGGSIQLLDIQNKASSENKRLMDIALREVSRLNRIVGEFLDYATDEESVLAKVEMEPVQVNSILEELLDNVRVNPKWEHINYHFTLQAKGVIQGHSDKFKQIFLNIVKNACEAMENQSVGKLEIDSFDDNEWVIVKIKDDGVGINKEDKARIYEPFYSKKESGTGLGLAIVRKLVFFYKGYLSYESHGEKGTICTLRFPIQPNFFPGELAQKKSA